jgi:hypothetical protein
VTYLKTGLSWPKDLPAWEVGHPGWFVDRGQEEAAIRGDLEETGLQVRVTEPVERPFHRRLVVVVYRRKLQQCSRACDETLEVGLFQYEGIPGRPGFFLAPGGLEITESICLT